ncbi:MAG: type II toxin-antitoxin system VapC family toxin [Acidimicrobiia bacterium]
MIFVDTNVWMYAVGGSHPLRRRARALLLEHADGQRMATSAEVLQELLHAYLPVQRVDTLDAALRLATELADVWSLDADDVALARALHSAHPGLSARDLIHLAVCLRREVTSLLSFDQGLVVAFGGR